MKFSTIIAILASAMAFASVSQARTETTIMGGEMVTETTGEEKTATIHLGEGECSITAPKNDAPTITCPLATLEEALEKTAVYMPPGEDSIDPQGPDDSVTSGDLLN